MAAACVAAVLRADQPPLLQMESTRRAITASVGLGAGEYAPDYIQAAEDTLKAASREIDLQITRFFVIRTYDLARTRISKSERLAREALGATAARRDSLRTLAFNRIDQARKALVVAQTATGNVQQDTYFRSKLVGLELLRQEALKAAAQGRFRTADQKAEAVIAGASAIQDGVDERLKDYQENLRQWNNWANATVSWSRSNRSYAILIRKLAHRLDLYYAGNLKASYPAELGLRWMGHKTRGGDAVTPEGRYHIVNKKAGSRYYKALEINYPNDEDRLRFQLLKAQGMISRRAGIGGLIEIHGAGGRGRDWTQGCVALRNSHIDALFPLVAVGTPVTIVGAWEGADGPLIGSTR